MLLQSANRAVAIRNGESSVVALLLDDPKLRAHGAHVQGASDERGY